MFSKLGGKVEQGVVGLMIKPGFTITAIVPINEEKTPVPPSSVTQSTPPTTAIESLLINRQNIITYTTQLANAKAHFEAKEDKAARRILKALIKKFPDYPEAYVELGDSYAKADDPEEAIFNYSYALQLAPFDIATRIKYTKQLQLFSKKNPLNAEYAVSFETLKNQLEESKELKIEERAFRAWYHTRLRYRFLELEINEDSPLTKGKSKSVDYQDISLSNGAAVETFLGMQALANKKYILAEYYFEKAIMKYEHDFIAWGHRVYLMLMTHTFVGDEIQEVTKIINKYHYSIAYFTRFMLYSDLDQDDLAYQDMAIFLCDADHPEFSRLMGYRDDVLNFLSEYSDPEGKIVSGCNNAVDASEQIEKVLPQIINKKFKGDPNEYIKMLNAVISRHPKCSTNYCTRGMFYEFKGDLQQANVNFSIAIWLADLDSLSVYLYHRARGFLMLGDVIAADQDFERALIFLRQISKENVVKEEVKALKDFAALCLKVARQLLAANEFESAEPIFNLGAGRALQAITDYPAVKGEVAYSKEHSSLLASLYLECVIAMRNLGRAPEVIRDYIFHAIMGYMHFDEKSNDLLHKKYDFLQKLVDKEKRKTIASKEVAQVEKKALSTPHRRVNFFNTTRPRQPATKFVFPEESVVDLAELQLKDTAKPKQEKRDEEKRKAKKLRVKAVKLFRLQQRKRRVQTQDSSSDSDDQSEMIVEPVNVQDFKIEKLTLTKFESKIFNMIYDLVPEEVRKNFKVYLGGGWAYDKIREKMLNLPINKYNDFDMKVNIPPEYLEKVFHQVAEVTGLYTLMVDGTKIDVVYQSNLDNLHRITKSCDFLSLLIDAQGNIHDVTGFGLINMLKQQLWSSLPPAEIFKDDPLRILRAIYTSTKRSLHLTTIKKQIKSDRLLLVPGFCDPDNELAENILHPHRFNIGIGKLFSQHFATQNFKLLEKFYLLDVLFPDICEELLADFSWLENQVLVTNFFPFPKVAIIYATFIASAVSQRAPVLFENSVLQLTEPMLSVTQSIYNNSLLFKDAFSNLEELFGYLQRALLDWQIQHEPPVVEEVYQQPCTTLRFGRN